MSLNSRRNRDAHYRKKERELRALERELHDLWKADRESRLIPLEKPLFAGYVKTHVIRDDIARSPYAKDAQMVLKYVGDTIYSRRKDFTKKVKKGKQMEAIPHQLRGIEVGQWKKAKLSEVFPLHLVKMFRLTLNKYKVLVYEFSKPWWFSDHVRRHYITHVKEPDGARESREAHIEGVFGRERYWQKRYGGYHEGERNILRYIKLYGTNHPQFPQTWADYDDE